jgi:heme exporter protein D
MSEVTNFINMGGYASYVWSAFGLSFIVLLSNVLIPLAREKKILRNVKKRTQKEKQKE